MRYANPVTPAMTGKYEVAVIDNPVARFADPPIASDIPPPN